MKHTGSRSGQRSIIKRWSWNDRSGSGRMTVRRCNKPDKTGLSAGICAQSLIHSPGRMAMHSGEIFQAQAARFAGEFTAGFSGLTPHSR
ncbi:MULTISPECIES: hypothetical protein [Bacteria]|nr:MULTISPECIES: hypothetical protein [Bacteria]ECN1181533.1 hypothetical protein [Salmonella enterica subsp. enterica serovar Montevideo]EGD8765288.1 hypothetical protein [Escherichia coli]EHC3600523.1 hypothetical protein [Salmonella enterica subsp. enterica serovar Enteritidis]HEN3469613.1 hypothetical protein [Yersinia enterocolitica]MBE3445151.1 hypothetical protein [Enterobacter cloacae complex sp. P25RS]